MKTPFLCQARSLLLAAVLPLLAAAASESPSLLLEKGIYAEEVEQNLDSAIKIYAQISAEAAASRSVVAQAQYRLAVCYQKQGKKEQAIKVLNEVLQQFPAEVSVSKKARTTLTELGVTAPETLSVRKIPLPISAAYITSISQDGRFVVYRPKIAAEPGDNHIVAVCEVATGKTWTIAKGTNDEIHPTWFDAKISPDGQWIAFQVSRQSGAKATIFIAKSDGSETRKLLEFDEKNEGVGLDGWSPDAKFVIVESWPTADPGTPWATPWDNHIFALDVKTGARKEIARVTKWESWAKMEGKPDKYTQLSDPGIVWDKDISSDRRYLARQRGSAPRTITILDLEAVNEEVLVDRDAGYVFGWFTGGTKLLYSKSRAGGSDLWATGIKDGKATGESELVWSDSGDVKPLCITPDGTVYGYYAGSAVLCVMQGLLTKTKIQSVASRVVNVSLAELSVLSDAIRDSRTGIAAVPPQGWKINSAGRPLDGLWSFVIHFGVPGKTKARPYLHVLRDPKLIPATEIDAWLRTWADTTNVEPRNQTAEYRNVPGTFSGHTIAGHRALSWAGEFKQGGENWIEQNTLIYSEKAPCLIRLRAPASDVKALRAGYDTLVASVRVP